jgi:hypothetical protein
MGKGFIAIMPDGIRRFAASMSMGRAKHFFDTAKSLEAEVLLPCGISEDFGTDEHYIDPDQFIVFCEKLFAIGMVSSQQGDVYEWARYATGMIENITFTPREWKCANGSLVLTQRYMRADEFPIWKPAAPQTGA